MSTIPKKTLVKSQPSVVRSELRKSGQLPWVNENRISARKSPKKRRTNMSPAKKAKGKPEIYGENSWLPSEVISFP